MIVLPVVVEYHPESHEMQLEAPVAQSKAQIVRTNVSSKGNIGLYNANQSTKA
jgi:hypothetical protein